MKAVRLILMLAGAVLAALILLLLAVLLFVNPNDYKDRIARQVRQSTGRELTLQGDIHLSVFPWVALEVGPASLGNPAGFSGPPFASLRRASLRVRVLPLLHHELQVGRVEIDGLDLRLRRDSQGRGNWQQPGEAAAHEQPAASAGGASGAEKLDLAGLTIRDGRMSLEDLVVDQLNVEAGHLGEGATAPVRLSLRITPGGKATPIPVQASLQLNVEQARQHYVIDAFDLAAAGAHLTGKLEVGQASGTQQVQGELSLQPVSARAVATALAVTLPQTRDPQAFSHVAASVRFNYAGNALRIEGVEATLDDSHLSGNASIGDLDRQDVHFQLGLDRIDLDRYRAPPAPPGATPVPAGAGREEQPTQAAPPKLSLDGSIKVGSVKVLNLLATQLAATVQMKNGVIHIAPAGARLYGGEYSGNITLDQGGPAAAVTVEQTLSNVDMAALMKDFAKSQRLSGRGTVSTSLRSRGSGSEQVLRSLNGRVSATLTNGAVEGLDLAFEINRAVSLVQKQSAPAGSDSGQTKFDTFKASADIADGIATTRDLSIASQALKVAGQGTANLLTEAIHYDIRATLLAGDRRLADVPVSVTGTLSAPKVAPDLEAMGKMLLQQQLGKQKQQLQQQLQDKLKGLFH